MGRYTEAHANTKGEGDARPTAKQIVKDENLENKLKGKYMIVSGVSSGIGIETVKALAMTGAHVFGTVRNMAKGQEALKDVLQPGGNVELVEMENESLQSVRDAAKLILEKSGGQMNVLVCNAGIMMAPEAKTVDGFERQFGLNYLSHFLLFQLLKPALLKSATPDFASRVVSVSSMGHRSAPIRFDDYNFTDGSYEPSAAYGQSKRAQIYMANHIDRVYGDKGIHAWSLHPGGIWSGLQVYTDLKEKMAGKPQVDAYMKSTAQGAATQVYAAVGKEWEGRGGKYMRDCEIAPTTDEGGPLVDAADSLAYSPENEARLWKDTLKMLGLPEDD